MAGEPLISIIDDDQAMRSALVRLIRSLGYVARGFASAEEFIEAGAMPSCSCVITDVQMPGMSGIHLTKLIAARQSPLPVILITARTEPGLEEVALASGAVAFFRKPIDTMAFVECLEMLMSA
ncbi:response regulator transcription factor [Sinorhizobium fredii]|uniref:Response regulator CheY-like domain-containing protein n=1 Tax=Rhizobium fredii TaxID=380 RepID=A0A2L0H2K0_RHIFR|nr:response regulator [Sinorhizobium fredii]AUX75674.1 response regulator CheY-like domain-containing protein [Sinorhizobium fredii]